MRRGSAMFIAQRAGQTDLVEMLQKDNAKNGFAEDAPQAWERQQAKMGGLPPAAAPAAAPAPAEA